MTATKPPRTRPGATPKKSPFGGQTTINNQPTTDDQSGRIVDGSNLTDSQHVCETQHSGAVGEQTNPPTKEPSSPKQAASAGQLPGSHAPQDGIAAGIQTAGDDQTLNDAQWRRVVPGPVLADPMLGLAAGVLDDLEKVRIANQNRLRQLTDTTELGFGLTLEHPDVARLAALVDEIVKAEHRAELNLNRMLRRHPLGKWAKPLAGVGEKQLARLLATIRDPYWNDLHERPRTVSELWAYCGWHVVKTSGNNQESFDAHLRHVVAGSNRHPDGHALRDAQLHPVVGVAPKRRRGQKSNWNEDARKRSWRIAESCMKEPGRTWPMPEGSPPANRYYRRVYETTRDKYADAVHKSECVRCGPKGKPAKVGSPLSLGHQRACGLRAVAKELLKDLWREAKRLHELPDNQRIGDTQRLSVVGGQTETAAS